MLDAAIPEAWLLLKPMPSLPIEASLAYSQPSLSTFPLSHTISMPCSPSPTPTKPAISAWAQ